MAFDPTDLATYRSPARDDARSVDELIAAALGLASEDDAYWDAIAALQWRDTPEVFDRAVALGGGPCSHERRTAAALLSQNLVPANENRDNRLAALRIMLHAEGDPDILSSILIALGHLRHPGAVELALPFVAHADADVRCGVIHALMCQDDDRALASLIALSRDPATENRDWATFALGSMIDRDTPELSEALADRLLDDDPTTASEALVGLARRRDPRALSALRNILVTGDAGVLDLEAAEELADPDLLPLLLALRPTWDGPSYALDVAVAACTP